MGYLQVFMNVVIFELLTSQEKYAQFGFPKRNQKTLLSFYDAYIHQNNRSLVTVDYDD